MPTPLPTDRLRLRRLGAVAMCPVMVLAGCTDDGRELRDPTVGLPAPPTPTTASTTASTTTSPSTTSPTTVATSDPTIEVDQLSSPANATAEMIGSGAVTSDPVTVDGEPADVLSFRADEQGIFVLQVWIEEEGAHTVCIADACGRVYTLAPDAESPEEIIAKIEAAIPSAQDSLDYPTLFPEWRVEIGGALAGTGGTTDLDTKTVTIYRNRGRTVDDFVRTVLHEFGHVTDFELLDDRERAAYLELRGLDGAAAWRDTSAHGSDDWGQQPGEDFAEVMVAIWSSGRWAPRTDVAADPTIAERTAILELVGPPIG
jgi:hypothetical protein